MDNKSLFAYIVDNNPYIADQKMQINVVHIVALIIPIISNLLLMWA